ncbi:histidine kinase [Streptomonospora sp. S1-112]|uniref:histidine kinase n=1 Tax=Streptomonospora mangrovi TaxID=2883123 RepID=A0A9X3NLE5_9ACTN|nr:histidine kinase [Streptomonospora mangrovi]MDA0565852.1 histidine kinase [Streptomonospora mangrovi]
MRALRTLRPTATRRRMSPAAGDALLAGGAAAATLAAAALDGWVRGRPPDLTDAGALVAWVLPVVAACAPLAVRRRAPLAAVAASAAVVLVASMVLQRDTGMWALALCVASAAYHRHRLRVVLAAGSAVWAAALALAGGGTWGLAALPVYAAAGAAPAAVGYALRLRSERAEQAERLQRAREERARADEAARIARDVHDIVGHHLSAIRLQAVGGRRALGGRDPEADRALGGIADLSAEALAEIRGLLATLVPTDARSRAADRGFADLAALAERSGGSELDVVLDVDPAVQRSGADAAVAGCVYRIVQEALTNAARHSAAGAAEVRVRGVDGAITVTVEDPGPPRVRPGGAPAGRADGGPAGGAEGAPSGGRGLAGMRERVAALGGSCTAGPRPEGGWRVRADLPARPPNADAGADAHRDDALAGEAR